MSNMVYLGMNQRLVVVASNLIKQEKRRTLEEGNFEIRINFTQFSTRAITRSCGSKILAIMAKIH